MLSMHYSPYNTKHEHIRKTGDDHTPCKSVTKRQHSGFNVSCMHILLCHTDRWNQATTTCSWPTKSNQVLIIIIAMTKTITQESRKINKEEFCQHQSLRERYIYVKNSNIIYFPTKFSSLFYLFSGRWP